MKVFSAHIILVLCCCLSATVCIAQEYGRIKPWKVKVVTGNGTFKGVLFNVTDSSLVVTTGAGRQEDILFPVIKKIKLTPTTHRDTKKLIGLVTGAAAGAIAAVAIFDKGANKPEATGGVVGGIAGGLAGAAIGFAIAPAVYNLFAAKRMRLQHNSTSYQLFKARLQPYAIRTQ